MSLRIKKIHFQLVIIMVVAMSYLYLLDIKHGMFGITYENIGYLISLTWCCFWLGIMSGKRVTKYEFAPWVIGSILLIILSVVQSKILYGQGFVDTLSPQKRIIVWTAIYFTVSKQIKCGYLHRDGLLSIIEKIGILQLVLIFAQFFLSSQIQVLHVETLYNSDRGLRYYYVPVLFDFLLFYKLDRFVRDKGVRKLKDLTIVVAVLLEVMIVQKYRMTSTGLLICIALFIILMRSKKQYKIAYVILGCVALVFLINTNFFQGVLNAIFSGNDAYLATRTKGRIWYFAAIMEHPIFGSGYPNDNNYLSLTASGYNEGILLNDNGVIGFVYLYGVVGVLWLISLWAKLLRKGWKIYKTRNDLVYLLFPLFFTITGITEAHWYWDFGFFFFMIYLAIVDNVPLGINND